MIYLKKQACSYIFPFVYSLRIMQALRFSATMLSTNIAESCTLWKELLDKAESLVKPSMLSEILQVNNEHSGIVVEFMKKNLKNMLTSDHSLLHTINQYYVSSTGKGLRPILILLLGLAVNKDYEKMYRHLSEITELIHTASLLHDDVIDNAHTRRHTLSANMVFGNKAAILSGDYMLATASVELAKLGNIKVVQSMATSLANLVHGEFMQLDVPPGKQYDLSYYLEKSFRKTASLMAESCRSIGLLANVSLEIQQALFDFGKYFGLAFQIIDDKLDYQTSREIIGKVVCADIKNGIITAPIIFASKTHHNILTDMIERNCSHADDMNILMDIVCNKSNALQDTCSLAQEMSDKAIQSLSKLEDSSEKLVLIDLVKSLLHRNK